MKTLTTKTIYLIFISLGLIIISCTKPNYSTSRVIGSKCSVKNNIFSSGDYHIVSPVTIDSLSKDSSPDLLYYSVSDAAGVKNINIPTTDLENCH